MEIKNQTEVSNDSRWQAPPLVEEPGTPALLGSIKSLGLSINAAIQRLYFRYNWEQLGFMGWGIQFALYTLMSTSALILNTLIFLFHLPERLSAISIHSRRERLFKLFELGNMPLDFGDLPYYCEEKEPFTHPSPYHVKKYYLNNLEPRILGMFDHLQLHLFASGQMNISFFSSWGHPPNEVAVSYMVNAIHKICDLDTFERGLLSLEEYDTAKERYVVERLWMKALPHIKISTKIDNEDRIQYTLTLSGVKANKTLGKSKKIKAE